MINLSKIDRLVKEPARVNSALLDDLEALSVKYPYSQVFSILYLKGLKNTGNVNFEEELTKHSFRITDRVQLYNLIQDTEVGSTPVEPIEIEEAVKEEPVVSDVSSVTEFVEETIEQTSVFEKSTKEETEQIQEPENKASVLEIKADDTLEENILHHVFTSTYQLDDLTDEEEEALDQRNTEKTESEEPITVQEEEQEEEKTVSKPGSEHKHSFTDWLKANNHYEEDDDKDREHIKQIVTNFENFDPSDDLFGEIKKPKAEFFSPAKKAKESLDDSSVPVSETLAKIYALQGNYPKAIEAYEQLSLINPEKKIFFANQIKELKKKIHSK